RRRHTRFSRDWSSDVCSSDLVLEHVHELKQTLELLLQKLKKRGTLFIAVPNYNSYDSKHYKENWAALDIPRHLYHFTHQTMEIRSEERRVGKECSSGW